MHKYEFIFFSTTYLLSKRESLSKITALYCPLLKERKEKDSYGSLMMDHENDIKQNNIYNHYFCSYLKKFSQFHFIIFPFMKYIFFPFLFMRII